MKFENFMKLSRHLGWQDMLSQVAMPAIQEIVDNYLALKARWGFGGLSEEKAVARLLEWSPEGVFALLGYNGEDWAGSKEEHMFISLRGEIEFEMRSGSSYQEAIAEWYK